VQWDDASVPRTASLALFDAFGSAEKTLHANPGNHGEIPAFELGQHAAVFRPAPGLTFLSYAERADRVPLPISATPLSCPGWTAESRRDHAGPRTFRWRCRTVRPRPRILAVSGSAPCRSHRLPGNEHPPAPELTGCEGRRTVLPDRRDCPALRRRRTSSRPRRRDGRPGRQPTVKIKGWVRRCRSRPSPSGSSRPAAAPRISTRCRCRAWTRTPGSRNGR